MADWASEAGHWYDAVTGEPRYTVIAKSTGKERPTTVRDAKANGWVPSVTTITGLAARYQLERWKAEQLLLAGLTLPRGDGETEADWIKRVWEDSKEQAKKAAERGTKIHAAVEQWFAFEQKLSGAWIADEWAEWVKSITNLITQQFGAMAWRPEKSFASPLGYGGKVDLHSDSVLIDFKGKEGDRSKWRTYDEHAMQLAAYAQGLGLVRDWITAKITAKCGIIFFDRLEPYAEWHEVKEADLERGWRKFEALLAYWKADNL